MIQNFSDSSGLTTFFDLKLEKADENDYMKG